MTLNTEKLTQFAQAVGADVKEIKTTLANKADKSEIGQGGITQQQLDTAIQGVKTAILGEGVPEELDTLKEIAEKIKAGENPDSAIVAKMTELGQKFTDLENTDFVQIYNTAKSSYQANRERYLQSQQRSKKVLVIEQSIQFISYFRWAPKPNKQACDQKRS